MLKILQQFLFNLKFALARSMKIFTIDNLRFYFEKMQLKITEKQQLIINIIENKTFLSLYRIKEIFSFSSFLFLIIKIILFNLNVLLLANINIFVIVLLLEYKFVLSYYFKEYLLIPYLKYVLGFSFFHYWHIQNITDVSCDVERNDYEKTLFGSFQFFRDFYIPKLFYYFFYFIIFFRLCLNVFPGFSFFIIHCLIFFALLNKLSLYLLFFSFFIHLSRIVFYISDNEHFNENIKEIFKIDLNENVILPNINNAKLISHWIARSFEDRDLYLYFKTTVLPKEIDYTNEKILLFNLKKNIKTKKTSNFFVSLLCFFFSPLVIFFFTMLKILQQFLFNLKFAFARSMKIFTIDNFSFTFSFLQKEIKKTQQSIINIIESNTSYKYPEYLEAFFLASFFLIIFKLIIRLFFHINPFWYYNLFVYFFGFVLYFFFPNIVFEINEIYIKITRLLLGTTYWSNMFYTSMPVSQEDYADNKRKYDDILKGNIFNHIYRKVFIFLVYLRLWIFKHNYLFIFFNSILTFFLIFNSFFLFSSFLSILLLLSRITIFISHLNKTCFFISLNKYEKIDENEYIVPNWKNAEILSFFILDSFVVLKNHRKEIREILKDKEKEYKMYFISSEIYFYEKYIQLYPEYNTENSYYIMLYSFRQAICEKEQREYTERDQLIKTKKDVSYFNFLMSVGVLKTTSQETEKIASHILQEGNAFCLRNTQTNTKDRIPSYTDLKKDNNHPENYILNSERQSMKTITESTFHSNSRAFSTKLRIKNNDKYSIIQVCHETYYKSNDFQALQQKINDRTYFPNHNIETVTFDHDVFTVAISRKDSEMTKFMLKLRDSLFSPNILPQTDTAVLAACIMFDKAATKKQAITAYQQYIEYNYIMSTKQFSPEIRAKYNDEIIKGQFVLGELQNDTKLEFASIPDKFNDYDALLNTFQCLIKNISSKSLPLANSIHNTYEQEYGLTFKDTLRHIHNYNHFPNLTKFVPPEDIG